MYHFVNKHLNPYIQLNKFKQLQYFLCWYPSIYTLRFSAKIYVQYSDFCADFFSSPRAGPRDNLPLSYILSIYFLRQALIKLVRLACNLQTSCPSLPRTGTQCVPLYSSTVYSHANVYTVLENSPLCCFVREMCVSVNSTVLSNSRISDFLALSQNIQCRCFLNIRFEI